MAFNKQDFLAAFLERTTEGIQERMADSKQYEAEQKELAKRNAQTVSKRKQTAEYAAQLGQQLINVGVGKADVLTAMSTGMDGVQKLHEKVTKALAQRGMSKIGPDDLRAIVDMPDIPALDPRFADPSKVDLNQFALETYGALPKAAAVEPSKVNTFGQLLGFGGRANVDRRLAEQQYMDGMSYADINAAAYQTDYKSLMPTATMTFMDVEPYGRKEEGVFTSSFLQTTQQAVNASSERIRAAGDNEPDPTKKNAAMAAERKTVFIESADAFIDGQIRTYGNGGFFNSAYTMSQIEKSMGPEYLREKYKENGVPVPEDLDKRATEAAEKREKQKIESTADPVQNKIETDPITADIRERVGNSNISFTIKDGTLRLVETDADGNKDVKDVSDTKEFFNDNQRALGGLSYKVVEAQLKETAAAEEVDAAPMPKDLTDDQDNTNAKGEKIFELNSDGTAPEYPEDNFMESVLGGDALKKRRQKLWLKLFDKTHNKDGSKK